MSTLFNKIIGGRQFNFQPIEFGEASGYHADVKDEEGTRWEFRVFRAEDQRWQINGEKLPAWITGLQHELGKAINDHE